MLENLFEEEGLPSLSGSGDENTGRVAESDLDGDIDPMCEEDARFYIVLEMSQSYDQRARYRLDERDNCRL